MMADCSRPPPHRSQRVLGKNLSSIFGFGNKGPYDDVFVSRPKIRAPAFTPAVKDYAEIFNCSNPSSIPVLELDEFEKREGFGDDINYGNVFGGLAEAQIASSHDEVFRVVGGDGVRKTDGSNAHSRGSGCSMVVEESQKMTLCEQSMSSDKITRGGKDQFILAPSWFLDAISSDSRVFPARFWDKILPNSVLLLLGSCLVNAREKDSSRNSKI